MPDFTQDATYFLELQTRTGWGRVLEKFADWCRPQPNTRALDVGCGPGLLPAILAKRGMRATGVDCDPGMFARPRVYPWLTLSAATRLPFSGGSFHLVTASNVLFFLPDPLAALREMHRVLHPAGQVALLNPSEKMSITTAKELVDQHNLQDLARETLLNWADRAERHARWTETDLRELFAQTELLLTETTLTMGPGIARFARAVKKPSSSQA